MSRVLTRILTILCTAVVVCLPLQPALAFTNTQRRDIELRPFWDPTDTGSGGGASSGVSIDLSGNSNAEKIWNYLIAKGLTPTQAAGVMGNIQAESSFNPGVEEKTSRPSKGFGIVQWTFGRRTALEAAAAQQGVPASDLGFQLGFMWSELTGSYKNSVYDPLVASKTLEDATYVWLEHYEIPANIPGNKPIRLGFAQNILKQPWATGSPLIKGGAN